MKNNSFHFRSKSHEKAVRMVVPILRKYSFIVAPHGREVNAKLEGLLDRQDDRCSLMVRYRPDLIAAKQSWRACLCEVKASGLIEARAFRGLQEWNKGGDIAFIVSCPDPFNYAKAAWIDALQPEPDTVRVPRRFDFDQQYPAIQKLFPQSDIKPVSYNGSGSGTPYFPLPESLMRPLDKFIEEELLAGAI